MSWFDAAGFANLAKSALKEAQKTIDKALDIKEEDQRPVEPRTEDTADFFASWGLKNEGDNSHPDKSKHSKHDAANSIWGSFTGSFFETPKAGEGDTVKGVAQSRSLQSPTTENVQKSKLVQSRSLPDTYEDQHSVIKNDAVPTQEEEDTEKDAISPNKDLDTSIEGTNMISLDNPEISRQSNLSEETVVEDILPLEGEFPEDRNDAENNSESVIDLHTPEDPRTATSNDENEDSDDNHPEVVKREPKENEEDDESSIHHALNRMSTISSESDKKSFESVEILGSRSNTECTTTPESDGDCPTNSTSPSAMGPKVNSESVEILPDSLLTSPSSVEILGEWKSDSSPYLSPMDPRRVDSLSTEDRGGSITPCWEDTSVTRIGKDDSQGESSFSDVSPYESPLEEVKTPLNSSRTSSLESTPCGAYPYPHMHLHSHPRRNSLGGYNVKISPESVEVILDTEEPDEPSLAEDSYTSASESTVMTILQNESLHQEQTKNTSSKLHDSCPDGRQILTKTCAETQLNLSLDSLKEKHNLHLPIEAITTQPIRKPEYLEGSGKKSEIDRLLNATIEPSEPERNLEDSPGHKNDTTLDTTDQYLMSTDSSCEGTLIESSSEENPAVRKSESKILETPLTSSSYVKTMLADAMAEKTEIIDAESQGVDVPRDNSPISSESRSDLVKIGSDQTSGHTSGDELETTTSSDIEIISRYSPNGDSSSTQSRQSPAKMQLTKGGDLLTKALKTRGHSRELSEISVGSDEANFEIEKLLKRIQEMTEILEARESKLIDVSRMNMELHEQNASLKRQLDNFEKHAEQSQSLNQITDEYTQRLSALERKFQQAIRERDSLRKNMEQLKAEAATRLSSQEMSTLSAEKDEIIKELREEGEKLSKQQLQHSNIIKKLRAKERETDAMMKNQKEQIEEQTSELERLKRSLHAKEEVERTQIEAVHTLTAKTKKQEKEILSLQEKLDNALHKMEAYKRSLDAAKVDLTETKKTLSATEVELKDATNNAGESCQLFAQVEDLKMKLRQSEESHAKKEEFLKHENGELLKRLEAAEARSEELSESVSMATKPLLRQLEQLQANLSHKSKSFMKQEKALSEKNIELQTKVENLIEVDRSLKEENLELKSKFTKLEGKFSEKEMERTRLQELHDDLTSKNEKLIEQDVRHQQTIETLEQSHASQMKELKREINSLENKLAVEKAATDAEKRKNQAILEQQQLQQQEQNIDDELGRLSPTTSLGKESMSSVNSVFPNFEDFFYGRMVSDSVTAASSTSIVENLQAQLKQRDGEIQQLQWELSRRNTERDTLNTELSTLTLKVEELSNKVKENEVFNSCLSEIQRRYDALLQMYGEKMEENQELRLDLEDIKEMYKTQIDQLLQRDA